MDNLIKELDLQAQKHISGGFWDWVVGTFLGGMLSYWRNHRII